MTTLFLCGEVDETAIKYVNRLSDFLFTAARIAGRMEGKPESVYRKYID
jgi:cob(I)alamin adenosyltransferase